MVQPVLLDKLLRVEAVAHAAADSQHADAACFLQVLSTSRAGHAGAEAEASPWQAARRFAERNGLHLTKPILRAALTYEVLQQPEPAAVLITRHRLTRRDLDLALALAQALPDRPSPAHRDVLRGLSPLR